MIETIKAVTNPLGLIVLVQLLTFACLQTLARGKDSKQLRRVSFFAFGFSVAILVLAITLYINSKQISPSVIRARIVDGQARSITNALLIVGEAGALRTDWKGRVDVPLSFFRSGSIQSVDVWAQGLESQSARLDAGVFRLQTLTNTSRPKAIPAPKKGASAK